MEQVTLRAAFAALGMCVAIACGSSAPTSPTTLSSPASPALGAAGGGQLQAAHHNPGHGGGPGGGGGGGGGGTADDFTVTMTGKIQTTDQDMQKDRDNKKALDLSGTIEPGQLSVDFSAWFNPLACTYTGKSEDEAEGTLDNWNSLADLRTTMASTLGRRDVNISIQHSGDGVNGLGAVRMLANPEGSDHWLSYCFNTGFGLCASTLVSDVGGVRTYTLDGGGIRAVDGGSPSPDDNRELACPDASAGPDVTIVVGPL